MFRFLFLAAFLFPLSLFVLGQNTNTAAGTAPGIPMPSVQPLATAVLDFQTSDSSLAQQGSNLATLLQADLSASPHALLVERQDIDKVLNEQELGASGLLSADTAAKIGSLTGAEVLVTGRLFMVGNQYIIVAKIISSETSRVYGVTSTFTDPAKLPDSARDLAGQIDGALASHRDALVVRQETPAQRLQRLKTLLGDRSLPSVSVEISERDYTQPTIDPAAQTEIIHDLQQLGFTVIALDQTLRKPDLVIKGEAFSELGARHGNLVSSRGRIELDVSRRATKELVWTDRDTRVAVDVGDHTAGKLALEQAAQQLVERMLPKLTK